MPATVISKVVEVHKPCLLDILVVSKVMQKEVMGDFSGALVVKNPPCKAGDEGSIQGQGTKIPHAEGQLSLCPATREARMPQLRPDAAKISK